MTDKSRKSASEKARDERLKAALRANLQRRKAQARVRGDGGAKAGTDTQETKK
ncbi:MAG: hypothetical protein WBA91_13905 [Paracoccaceae bacterium]